MWEAIKSATDKLVSRTTVASFIIGAITAAIIASVVSLSLGEVDFVWPPSIKRPPAYGFMISFILSYVISTFISYILMLREGEDYLTPLRKSIKGNWAVHYADWQPNAAGNVVPQIENDIAKIGIGLQTRKLYIKLNIANHQVFGSFDTIIEDISLNSQSKPMRITYTHKFSVDVSDGTRVEGDVLVRLDILLDDVTQQPVKLVGTWYDLDHVFMAHKSKHYTALSPNRLAGQFKPFGMIEFKRIQDDTD